MKIEAITIEGFKSVADLTLDFPGSFVSLAGSNGAGKSNITDAIAFLGGVVKRGASQAIRDAGGFHQIHCFKYRKEKRTTIRFAVKLTIDGELFDYGLKITDIDKIPVIQEYLYVDGVEIIRRPANSITKVRLGSSADFQEFSEYPQDMTALMLFGHSPLYQFLINIKVFRIDPVAAKRPNISTEDATELHFQGQNVATILSVLEKKDDFRAQILEWIELIVPGVRGISTEKQRLDGTTVITFKEEGLKAQLPARLISDGTIYAICIMTALLSRSSQLGLTIIEEPERGVHPKAIGELVSFMRDNASPEHPVFVTTHSESIVRNLNLEELWLVEKKEGKTLAKSVAQSKVDKNKIPLDTAWLTNLLNGGLPW
ncbi:ABC transporter ATP-binding protein [Pseudomonas sp. NZIPFR-PS5]|nr:ABC transporter ATP-binding protein [Pseudomonas sp. NZIPFR-PS5]